MFVILIFMRLFFFFFFFFFFVELYHFFFILRINNFLFTFPLCKIQTRTNRQHGNRLGKRRCAPFEWINLLPQSNCIKILQVRYIFACWELFSAKDNILESLLGIFLRFITMLLMMHITWNILLCLLAFHHQQQTPSKSQVSLKIKYAILITSYYNSLRSVYNSKEK